MRIRGGRPTRTLVESALHLDRTRTGPGSQCSLENPIQNYCRENVQRSQCGKASTGSEARLEASALAGSPIGAGGNVAAIHLISRLQLALGVEPRQLHSWTLNRPCRRSHDNTTAIERQCPVLRGLNFRQIHRVRESR